MKLSEFKKLVLLEEVKGERKLGNRFAISKKVQEIQFEALKEKKATAVFFIEVISNSSTSCNLQIKQEVIDYEECQKS